MTQMLFVTTSRNSCHIKGQLVRVKGDLLPLFEGSRLPAALVCGSARLPQWVLYFADPNCPSVVVKQQGLRIFIFVIHPPSHGQRGCILVLNCEREAENLILFHLRPCRHGKQQKGHKKCDALLTLWRFGGLEKRENVSSRLVHSFPGRCPLSLTLAVCTATCMFFSRNGESGQRSIW